MKIADATPSTITDFWTELDGRIQGAACLEDAAQALASELQGQFEESVVIARVFLTVPYGSLPADSQQFVQNLAQSAGGNSELTDRTPVLALVGTHGAEAQWCDRRKSAGHVGIPLISSVFVEAIPMISRLLRELGVPLTWVDSHDTESVVEHIGRSSGLFFVGDAAEATDQQNRKIIAAQDFVADYQVKSVFGIGGAYENGQMIVTVVFCRDRITRDPAEHFLPLSSLFQGRTAQHIEAGTIFGA